MADNQVKNNEEVRLTDHFVASTGLLLHEAIEEINGGEKRQPFRKISSNEEAVMEALDEARYDGPGKFSTR